MGKVAANADFFLMACGRAIASGMVVAKFNAAMNEVADGLNALPSGVDMTEQHHR